MSNSQFGSGVVCMVDSKQNDEMAYGPTRFSTAVVAITLAAGGLLIFLLTSQLSGQEPDSELARIPFQRHMNIVLVEVKIGDSDKPLTLMLDCGSTKSLIDREVADQINLKMSAPRKGGRTSAGGQFTMRTAPRVSFDFGNYKRTLSNLTVAQFEKSSRAMMGTTIHGMLGQDFFKNVTLEFDYVAQEMIVHDPKKYRYSGDGSELKIKFDPNFGNLPYTYSIFETSDGTEHEIKIFVDSGGVVMGTCGFGSPSAIKAVIPVDAPRVPAMGATGVADTVEGTMHSAFVTRAHQMKLGKYIIERPVIGCTNNLPHNAFGAELLHRFDVVFDYERNRIIVEPNTLFDEPIPMDASGMMLIASPDDANVRKVMFVVPKSPAGESGIRQGDEILEINDKSVDELSLIETRELFCEADEEHSLKIKRKGEILSVSFRTRVLY